MVGSALHDEEGHHSFPGGARGEELDSAMTNREARPHLVRSYRGMQSLAFNCHLLEVKCGDGSCKALERARKRRIDLRGFSMEINWFTKSGDVLLRLMLPGNNKNNGKKLDIANYYAERGKLVDVDATGGGIIQRWGWPL